MITVIAQTKCLVWSPSYLQSRGVMMWCKEGVAVVALPRGLGIGLALPIMQNNT